MIRILHVLGALNRGGAETMVMNLYREMDRTKVQFDFIIHTTEHCDYTDEIIALGGRIYSIPKYKGLNHFQYCNGWADFFRKHPEYKVLHSHVRSTASIYIPIAKKHGLKTIIHSHSTSNGKGLPALVKNTMQFPLRYMADYFFACSTEAGKWLFGSKIVKSKKFKLLKNAIKLNDYTYSESKRTKIRNEFNLGNEDFIVGTCGRLTPQKNPSFIIDIISDLHKQRPDIKFMWIIS